MATASQLWTQIRTIINSDDRVVDHGDEQPSQIQACSAFSETDAGADINRAMFVSFVRLFNGISRSLGRAAATEMTSQEL